MYAYGVTLFCVTVRVTFFLCVHFYRVNSPFKLFLTQEKKKNSSQVNLFDLVGIWVDAGNPLPVKLVSV